MSMFRFDHIHLFTRDPEATVAFYERMFGAEVIRSMPQGKPAHRPEARRCQYRFISRRQPGFQGRDGT